MRRKLGGIESALAMTDEFMPLNAVGVVRMEGPPLAGSASRALDFLQARHPLLRMRILKSGGSFWFDSQGVTEIPLDVVEREDDQSWVSVVERELNQRFDAGRGPLMRCVWLAGSAASEVVLTFHHSITDGAASINLLHELLTLTAAGPPDQQVHEYPPMPGLPPSERFFPDPFRGVAALPKTARLLGRQTADQVAYWRGSRGLRSPIHRSGRCQVHLLRLSKGETTALVRATRRRRISVHNALNAAMLWAVDRHFYGGGSGWLRGITFTDLRPYLRPPLGPEHLGCYISFLPYATSIHAFPGSWDLVEDVHHRVFEAALRHDKFAVALLAKQVMRLTLRWKFSRLANAALTYTGPTRLSRTYGRSTVVETHGFVSNNVLGAELAAVAGLFDGKLWWNILYMDSDMDRQTARLVGDDLLGFVTELR